MTAGTFVAASQLSDFVGRVEAVTEEYPQMNEDNTKSKVLRDFLELLGWDVAFDAELEYQLIIGQTKNYVDYALFVDESSPALFVEAKGYDTPLKDAHRTQLHSYLRQLDVDWGLLTNGRRYEIFRRENVEGGVEIRLVAGMELAELPDNAEYVSLLAKASLEKGHSRELAKEIFNARRAKGALETNKEAIAERISDVVTEEAGDVVSQRARTEAKEMVDRLIEDLDDQTRVIGPVGGDSFWDDVERATDISKSDDGIELVEGTTATDDYVDFVRYLFEEGYLTRDDLPIESGRTRYMLHTEPEHKNGTEMYNPKEVVDGVFLEAHQNTDDKKRRILQLGESFGRDAE